MIDSKFDELLKELIKDYKLTDFEDEIFKISKPAIVILANEEDKFEEVGNTRFGHQPDVYPELENWLVEQEKINKQPCFLGQINLGDISKYQNILPDEGILYFFDSSIKYYKGNISNLRKISIEEKELWISPLAMKYNVTQNPDGSLNYIGRDASVPYKVEFKIARTLPYEDTDIVSNSKISENYEIADKYQELVYKLDEILEKENKYIGNLFGHYSWEYVISREIMSKLKCKYEEMVTLLTLVSENNVNFQFSDGGEATCCIKSSDLKNLKFNKAVWETASS